ncbi:chemokine-like receptor 1 [Microcaecilia unicolor]|uniref:Chemokine-like receptor 1 n=1 Tax=Microcaecilia unicolor TaxID=1415580 RepID=A0A6P7Z191_9AMPH|nr:chemokine-like receptor 1 [Microcaecilia unicolor]
MENFTQTPSFSTNVTSYNSDDYFRLYYIMQMLLVVSYSITCLLGLAGNGLVIWITVFRMKKTVNTVWFFNLAIADFIFDAFLPISIVETMDNNWVLGKVMCKVHTAVLYLNMFASIAFLTIISIDRCISTVCPVWSNNHRTPRLATAITLVIWFMALITSSPYPAFYDLVYYPNNSVVYCDMSYGISQEDYTEEAYFKWHLRNSSMIITRFLCMFLIPFFIIVVCYAVIVLTLKRKRNLVKSSKPFKVIIAILVCFFFCWFPYHVYPFLDDVVTPYLIPWKVRLILKPLTCILAFFNSCINPILYVFMGQDFKKKVKISFLGVFERAFTEGTRNQLKDMTEMCIL